MTIYSTADKPTTVLASDGQADPDESRALRIDDYVDAVIRSTPMTATAQAVLWRYARYANRGTGEAWPSFTTVAKDCHVHRDTVWRAVTELVAAGVIACEYRPGRSALIRFPIHPAVIHTPRADAAGPISTPPAPARRTPRVGAMDPPRGRDTEPLYEPVYEPAPRCPQCDERHNPAGRCSARDSKLKQDDRAVPNVVEIDAIRERWQWQL